MSKKGRHKEAPKQVHENKYAKFSRTAETAARLAREQAQVLTRPVERDPFASSSYGRLPSTNYGYQRPRPLSSFSLDPYRL